jgi:peptidoglycan/LPS O-acetylase OafA/YrhL
LLADEQKQLAKHIAAGSSFISNFILWNESGYFDIAGDTKPLKHLWSLGIEEQFYIIWPLLLWLAWKRRFNLFTITLTITIGSFLLNLEGIKRDPVATFYSPQTRLWELLSGSLLAWFSLYKKNEFARIKGRIDEVLSSIFFNEKQAIECKTFANVLSFSGIFLLVYGFWRIDDKLSFPGMWALVPVLGSVLIIAAGPKALANRSILSNKVAVWFGLISFPLYLWHWPLLSFARIVESELPNQVIRILAVALSIALAWITYKLIERPIRFGVNAKFKVLILLVFMVIVGSFSFYSYHTNLVSSNAAKALHASKQLGWEIFPSSPEQLKLCHDTFPERSKISLKEKRDDNICLLQSDSIPNVLLIGDSINTSLFPGLAKFNDYNILVLSASGALPFYNVRTGYDGDFTRLNNFKLTNQALDYAINNKNIKVVVLATIAGVNLVIPDSTFKITDVLNSSKKDPHNIFVSSLRFTIEKLLNSGKDIIYVLPNPGLTYDIKSCLGDIRPFRLPNYTKKTCSQTVKKYFKDQGGSVYREWVMSVLNDFPQVKVFDAALPFCDSYNCYGSKDVDILYRDQIHLSISGSNLVAPNLHSLIINSLNH